MGKKQLLKRLAEFEDRETDFAKKSIQNFKILLTQKGLLLDIQKFRKKWKIPVNFDARIFDEPEPEGEPVELPMLEQFKNRKEWAKAVNKIPLFNKIAKEIKFRLKHHETDEEYKKRMQEITGRDRLMKKYKISYKYLELFKLFVNTGRVHSYFFKSFNRTGAFFFTPLDVDGIPCMAIRIFPETTTKDIVAEWPEIELNRDRFLGFNLPKQLERKNIDRDLRVIQLKYFGKNSKDIAAQIKKEFPGKTPLIYQDINKIIYDINQLHITKPLILP